ncbi:hypothetical protein Lal_00021987 [Lupinus albus]|nr:hypothetical protein Lal_00021987 [Lupinus albus]
MLTTTLTLTVYAHYHPHSDHFQMGDKIQVSVRKEEFNEWKERLVENKTYVMHNFNVFRNELQFKVCDHTYGMQFTAGTTLKQKEFPDIPENEYDFKKIGDILSGNYRTDLLIDIIGAFHKLIFSQTEASLKKIIFSLMDFRYKQDIKVIHKNGSGKFVFWDRQCVDIIDISAADLRNQMLAEGEDDPKAYILSLDFLLARTMTLRVKVQPSYKQSFVIRHSEDPNMIKTILDTMYISITADHDPDPIQVVTPAKRLSPDFDIDLLQSPIQNFTQLSSSKVAKHIKTK